MGTGDKIRAHPAHQALHRFCRTLQFFASLVAMGLFSAYLARDYTVRHRHKASSAAVEAILAASTLYALVALMLTLVLKRGIPRPLRWLLSLLDLLFLGALIGTAVLTRPKGGLYRSCSSTGSRSTGSTTSRFGGFGGIGVGSLGNSFLNCKLMEGVFACAIIGA